MAKLFTSAEARTLIDEQRGLLNELEYAAEAEMRFRNAVSATADRMVAEEVMKLLKDIPVEELNRDRRGLRIKSLRDSGFDNLADIAAAGIAELESVNGISEDGAYTIKRIYRQISENASKGVKIRLSADNRTSAATELVIALSQYRACRTPTEICRRLLRENRDCVEKNIELLFPALSELRWFFTLGSAKEVVENAYSELRALSLGSYTPLAKAQCGVLDELTRLGASAAWDDFQSNSIAFINALEDICPGLLGNDDSIYGLPEELARDIQDEEFFPEGLSCELRRYQEWGVKYILHQGNVLLGDEMGLGKTVQAIAAMVSLRNTGATHFVVVCPASVISNWCREIRKFSRLHVIKVHGGMRDDAIEEWLSMGGVAVTTYETVGVFKLDEGFRYSMLVVDEAHYIKNPSARRSIYVKKLSSHAERKLFMTGTALENRVDEMIELIKLLDPVLAVSLHGLEALSAAPRFRELIAPVYYRRKREDVLTELPELIESKEWCDMGRLEAEIYEAAMLESRFVEARRVSWNVIDPAVNSSKAKRLIELVKEAEADGRKVIVFSFFLDTIKTVCEILGERCTVPITGSVQPQRRQDIIDRFESMPAGSVLPAQIQSGGTGLNIQSASMVIICEPQFKPSIENQAISRAYRMGQTRNVLVYRLLCEDSIDEKIIDILTKKQATFDAFADKSVAAEQSLELDDLSLGEIIQEEVDRIRAKRGIYTY